MAQPRKLLIWHWGRRGGGVMVTLLLARRLIQAGHRDDIALSLSAQNELIDEFKALGLPLSTVGTFADTPSKTLLLKAWPSFRRALQTDIDRFQPATILVPMLFGATLPLLPVAKRQGRKFVYVIHDVRSHPGESIGLEQSVAQFFLFRFSDHLVTMSHNMRDELLRRLPRLESRVTVEPLAGLYDGVRGARTFPGGRRLRFLVAGRQVRYKGYERLAQALQLLGRSDFDITIAGDGPERTRVAELFGRMPNVQLRLGWASTADHQRLFENHDVLLCPYDEASQSALVCDALTSSLPTVVTPVGALPEQISFGKAGWVTADMSAAALADVLAAVALGGAPYAIASSGCQTVLDDARAASNWPRTLGLERALTRQN